VKELPKNFGLKRLKGALGVVEGRRTAIDIGAHKGIWTNALMDEFESVHSFEPIGENFSTLKKINPNSYQVALGEKIGVVGFLPGDNTGMWHITDNCLLTQKICKMDTLDAYKIEDVDFIKIDVEGYELHVLEGSKKTIKKYKPDILLEENGLCERYGVTHDNIWGYMTSIGYENVNNWQADYLWSSTKN